MKATGVRSCQVVPWDFTPANPYSGTIHKVSLHLMRSWALASGSAEPKSARDASPAELRFCLPYFASWAFLSTRGKGAVKCIEGNAGCTTVSSNV